MGRRSERYRERTRGRAIEPTAEREQIERRWFKRSREDESLSGRVTGADLRLEPFHRWMPYTQGFSPALVREFIERAEGVDWSAPHGLFDPFAGSGTAPIECARNRRRHLGVEAIEALVFLAQVTASTDFAPLPDLRGAQRWQDAAGLLHEPLHRAALMLAVSRQYTMDGERLSDAPALAAQFNEIVRLMRADLREPLPQAVKVQAGDARSLPDIADASVGGVLTSPPYLSRHDYARQTRPIRSVFARWQAGVNPSGLPASLTRSRPGAATGGARSSRDPHPAEAEACLGLQVRNRGNLADLLRCYFDDLHAALGEMSRLLRGGCPAWIVIGGARLADVYVPCDWIVAELAQESGFEVRAARIARRLIAAGRKLGGLQDVAPRESLLELRRCE